MPKIVEKYERKINLSDLKVGSKLTITKVELGETEKEHYPCFTLHTKERGKVFGTQKGVIYKINEVGPTKITEKDPLIAVINTYFSKQSQKDELTLTNP